MLRPCILLRRSAPDGDVEAAAQLVVQRRRRGDRHLDLGPLGVEAVQARDQPAHRERRRRADPQDPARVQAAAGLGGGDDTIEGQADLGREGARRGGGHHAPPGPHEQALTEPALQRRDLAADGAMGQAEFGPGLGIAAGAGRDLEDAQGIERRQAAHGTREENRQIL